LKAQVSDIPQQVNNSMWQKKYMFEFIVGYSKKIMQTYDLDDIVIIYIVNVFINDLQSMQFITMYWKKNAYMLCDVKTNLSLAYLKIKSDNFYH